MDKAALLQTSWEVITAMILSIAWLIRLESKVLYLEKDHDLHKTSTEKEIDLLRIKHEDLENKIVEKLSAIEKALARIQGQLSINDDKNT